MSLGDILSIKDKNLSWCSKLECKIMEEILRNTKTACLPFQSVLKPLISEHKEKRVIVGFGLGVWSGLKYK